MGVVVEVTASSVRRGVADFTTTVTHIVFHPAQLKRLPRWVREINVRPLDVRMPWWPYEIVEYVSQELPGGSRVLEFGGGGSSLWLADRGATLTVVEHHSGWAEELRGALPPSVEVVHEPPSDTGTVTSSLSSGYFDDYVAVIDRFPDTSLDLVVVDGRARVECAVRALPKIKQGGMLLLDDCDRRRYRRVHETLRTWPKVSFRGLKCGNNTPATTSVWRRP